MKGVKTFNEKIMWIMKNDKNPLKVRCSDKLLCKKYIEEKVGEGFTAKTYVFSDSVEHISFASG